MHTTSAGSTYPSANTLVETNNRETKTIEAISLLASATTSNRDTYVNILETVASLMLDILISNKNLVEALKENTRLDRVLGQCQKSASTAGGGGETGRGGTSQHKKGAHYCWSHGYDTGHPSFKCTAKAMGHVMHCSSASTKRGSQKKIRNDGHQGKTIS